MILAQLKETALNTRSESGFILPMCRPRRSGIAALYAHSPVPSATVSPTIRIPSATTTTKQDDLPLLR
jgi:hypothetical protein